MSSRSPQLPPQIDCLKTGSWDVQKLDALHPVWAGSTRISLLENSSGYAPRWGTEVRISWTDGYLQGLFLCQDSEPWATIVEHDGPLWEQEVVEIFLDPFGDGLCYFEIEINPLNTVTDIVARRTWTGLKKDITWDCKGLETAVGTLAYGWVVGFRIPFASLGDCHPEKNPVWRANFYRIDRPLNQPRELSAWSPTFVGTFHVPYRFGTVRFSN